MTTYTAKLILVKGVEVTIEHLIGPGEDEIDECQYDVENAGFILSIGNDDYEIDTDQEPSESEDPIPLTEEQYVKGICWRTTEWELTSERPITVDDIKLIKRKFGDVEFVSFDVSDDVECEFDTSWDGKWQEIIQEASNPTYSFSD